MKFGVVLPSYDRTGSWDAVRQVAVLAEELAYASIWTTDHLLVPKENVRPYGNIYDALVTLALVAPLVPRLQVGTSVLVLTMRNPVVVAKQAVTIDAATSGRMILGVAAGWNEKEFANLGANFRNRGKRLDEEIELLRAVWANREITFNGKHYQIADGYSAPAPVHGTIPIWIGGNEEPSLRRTARLGDGWHTTGAAPEEMARGIKRIRELGAARPLTFSARLSIDFDPNVSPTYEYRGKQRYRLVGPADRIRARLGEYAQAGVEQIMLVFPWEDISVGLTQMRQFAREVMPGMGSEG